MPFPAPWLQFESHTHLSSLVRSWIARYLGQGPFSAHVYDEAINRVSAQLMQSKVMFTSPTSKPFWVTYMLSWSQQGAR